MYPHHRHHHHCHHSATINLLPVKGRCGFRKQPQLRAPLRRAIISAAIRVMPRQSPHPSNERVTQDVGEPMRARGNDRSWAMQPRMQRALTCPGYPIVSQRSWMVCQILSTLFDNLFNAHTQCYFAESSECLLLPKDAWMQCDR
jgi:hypothetical protein